MMGRPYEIRVLFVCMGNICRSPSAEAIMQKYVNDEGLAGNILCDSAGTISYHVGELADPRMRRHAEQRDYDLTSISRQLTSDDFINFDYIIAMDHDNMENMHSFMPNQEVKSKVFNLTEFCTNENPGYVPDPYYGGAKGFEEVLDILEDGCKGLLNKIKSEHFS